MYKVKTMITHMLFVCIILLTFGFVSSNPVIFEYESISDDEFATNISSEFEDDISYSWYPVEIIERKKRDIPTDFNDNNNTSFLLISPITTTTAQPIVNLSDVIHRIEIAFLNSAANIIHALKNFTLVDTNSNKSNDNNNNLTLLPLHQIEKREILSENPNDFTTQNETTEIDISTEPITTITVHVPPVAKIAIYPNVGYFPMIPTFDYNLNKKNDDNDDDDDIQLPDDNEKSTKLKRSLLETINGTENFSIKATTIKTEKSTSSLSSTMIIQDPTMQHKNVEIEDEM